MYNQASIDTWIQRLTGGDRQYLSRAITLIESQKAEDRKFADALLKALPKRSGSLRIGITGPPGAGKSTLIESLGLLFLSKAEKIAILSIDPSSVITKGSILGDKTRMSKLSTDLRAFVRPSPTGDHLGGVAQHTRESIWLCEAAGFDFILVETAGIGQSEYQVSTMTDLTILLVQPGSGDELQGIKKGILEWSDIIALNKADDPKDSKVTLSYKDLISSQHFFSSRHEGWNRRILKVSALLNRGIEELYDTIVEFNEFIKADARITELRTQQLVNYFNDLLKLRLWNEVLEEESVQKQITEMENMLIRQELSPESAADISIRFIFALFNKKQ